MLRIEWGVRLRHVVGLGEESWRVMGVSRRFASNSAKQDKASKGLMPHLPHPDGNFGTKGFWKYSTPHSGPKRRVTILGGVHGNELVGINVVKRLVEDLEQGTLKLSGSTSAELVLGLGNLQAIEMNARSTGPGLDLNRCFTLEAFVNPEKKKKGNASYEWERAKEMIHILADSDILVDLHATNKPSDPFIRIAGYCREEHVDVASWFAKLDGSKRKTKLLIDRDYVLGNQICTTDEFVGAVGNVGICVETGLHNDQSMEKETYKRVVEMLAFEIGLVRADNESPWPVRRNTDQDMLPSYGVVHIELDESPQKGLLVEDTKLRLPSAYDFLFEPYLLTSSHVLTERGFEWEEGFGVKNWQAVKRDQTIGRFSADASMEIPTPSEDSKGKRTKSRLSKTRRKIAEEDIDDEDDFDQENEDGDDIEDDEGGDEEDEFEDETEERQLKKTCVSEYYVAPEDSVILFPKVKSLWNLYSPLFWLAKKVTLPSTAGSEDFAFVLQWTPATPTSPGRYRPLAVNHFVVNRIKKNTELFVSFMGGWQPGVGRKSGKLSDLQTPDKTHILENPMGVLEKLKTKVLSQMTSSRHSPLGFNLKQSLMAVKKVQDMRQAGEDFKLDTHSRQIVHVERSPPCAVIVYPTTYNVLGEFFQRGSKPYYSPRVVIPFPVRYITKGSSMYLGVECLPRNLEDRKAKLLAFEQVKSRNVNWLQHGNGLFLECSLFRSAYLITEKSPVDPFNEAVAVVGSAKLDVGKSYVRVAHVLEMLGTLVDARDELWEYHPVYSDRCELLAVFGLRQKLNLSQTSIIPDGPQFKNAN